MTPKDIEKSLSYRLSEYLAVYPIAVDYPNVSYSPVVGTPYLKVDYLHGTSAQVEVGTKSADRETGIYQITLNVESNNGSSEATTIITQLKEYFKRGTVASYNGLDIRITKFNLGRYSSDGDWFREVVDITFRADMEN